MQANVASTRTLQAAARRKAQASRWHVGAGLACGTTGLPGWALTALCLVGPAVPCLLCHRAGCYPPASLRARRQEPTA
jgi:hypothetical protein